MKQTLGIVLLVSMAFAPALASENFSRARLRVADATSDACLANCATQDASCQRICPTTLRSPCVSACESQAQTCRQACQSQSR
ncbi:hypothetical protein QU42_25980 [Bradyrhizobium sp. UASWS1016]|jgi:hypothetical protein|nr:hypothetical protein CWS35_36135 [Bradyrhizobium sp. SK17]KIU51773.1 hypothetical protein QU41_04330 [Bradyrhizobium elkanii]OCX28496.1 hypothetical protein QU42_25980 [Bradyrhizobium sp. UASWS1016]